MALPDLVIRPASSADVTAEAATRVAADLTKATAIVRKSGRWYTSPRTTLSTTVVTDGQLHLIPFDVGVALTLDRIGCWITSGGTVGSVVRLGIYNDDGTNNPGTLLLDVGEQVGGLVDGTVITAHTKTISQALTPGRYWLAVCPQGAPGTSPTMRSSPASSNDPTLGLTANADVFGIGYYKSAVAGAFTSPVTITGAYTLGPAVTVRVA